MVFQSDWSEITRNVDIDHDLEATPLQILTNTVACSNIKFTVPEIYCY